MGSGGEVDNYELGSDELVIGGWMWLWYEGILCRRIMRAVARRDTEEDKGIMRGYGTSAWGFCV